MIVIILFAIFNFEKILENIFSRTIGGCCRKHHKPSSSRTVSSYPNYSHTASTIQSNSRPGGSNKKNVPTELPTPAPRLKTNAPPLKTNVPPLKTNTPPIRLPTPAPRLKTNAPQHKTNAPPLKTNVPPLKTNDPPSKTPRSSLYFQTASNSQSNSRTAILSTVSSSKAPAQPTSVSNTIHLPTSSGVPKSASYKTNASKRIKRVNQSQSQSNISSKSQINYPQSPTDISANRIAYYDANSYIIPNIEIRRPFDSVGRSKETDRFVLLVCSKYISRKGCNLKYCFRFHVCHKWIIDNCKEDECSFEHSFHGEDNSTLFDRIISRNFGEDDLKKRLRRNLFFKKDYKEDPRSSICMDFILKQCNRQDCESHHIISLYSWKVFLNNHWLKFSKRQNEEIEKHFCNPAVSSFTLDSKMPRDWNEKTFRTDLAFPNESLTIDFQSMSLTTSNQTFCRIKRLSTPSDVTVFNTVATRWLWYYEDGDNIWKYYTNASVKNNFILPFSDYIEIQFLKKIQKFDFKCSLNGKKRTINFEDMSQTNSYTGIKHEIRCRPMPSYSNAKWKKYTKITDLWTNLNGKEKYLLQKVPKESPEFYFVKNMIASSLPLLEIFIKRVENPYLWEAYQLKKAQMMLIFGNDIQIVNEQYMFHGTSKDVIDKICTDNLDWRLYGTKVGSVYGKGTYFANTAKVSNHYASTDDEGFCVMFVSLVLVGRATVGNSKMTIPPIDPLKNIRFDSTVNDKNYPKIFVKYNLDEYYPAYLVKYSLYNH